MNSEYNSIEINQLNHETSIKIEFKKSSYHSDIVLNYMVLSVMWIVGIYICIALLMNENSDNYLILIIWFLLLVLFTYQTFICSLWLRNGKEQINIQAKKIIVTKFHPQHALINGYEETYEIKYDELENFYYSEHITFRKQIPSYKCGHIHFKFLNQKVSIGINFSPEEAEYVMELIENNSPIKRST
ncbi:hypothetical protein [Acinetobacter shaoyimingii]|uniref:Uncharacterized protein n=1 Tax=Acinetobacter shaoyimingii TaxID=2715164 RepID=A0A6G8RWI6_9GAMM|nr:hypothetical protein [Acinetobacter shaoyimingii]QIO06274.1 hypothetical protein G8E00_10050 [Acinetobacter shaoyimingii]